MQDCSAKALDLAVGPGTIPARRQMNNAQVYNDCQEELGTNRGSLLVSKSSEIQYRMTLLFLESVSAFVEAITLTSKTLVNTVYRSAMTITC